MSNKDPNVRCSILIRVFSGEVANQTNSFWDPRRQRPNSQGFSKAASYEMLQSNLDYLDFSL